MSLAGSRIKQVRLQREMTQKDLADKVGVHQATINDLENGRTKSSNHWIEMAMALGVDANWLKNGVGEPYTSDVYILQQGAQLPLLDDIGILEMVEKRDFNVTPINKLFRCPVKHSVRTFTYMVTRKIKTFMEHSVVFVDPDVDIFNGSCVLVALSPSGMIDIRHLVSDGSCSYLQSLDPTLDASVINKEFSLETIGDGVVHTAQSDCSEKAIIVGKIIFAGHPVK